MASAYAARLQLRRATRIEVPDVAPADRSWYIVASTKSESAQKSQEAFSAKVKPRVISKKGKRHIELEWRQGEQVDVVLPEDYQRRGCRLVLALFVESVVKSEKDVCVGKVRIPVKKRKKKAVKLRGFNTGWVPSQKYSATLELDVDIVDLETPRLALDGESHDRKNVTFEMPPQHRPSTWDNISDSESDHDEPSRRVRTRTKGLEVGSEVHARYLGGATWVPGVIAAAHGNGTFDVEYTDGSFETSLKGTRLRIPVAVKSEVLEDVWRGRSGEYDLSDEDSEDDAPYARGRASSPKQRAMPIVRRIRNSLERKDKSGSALKLFRRHADAPGRPGLMTPTAMQNALAETGIRSLTRKETASLRTLTDPGKTGLMDYSILVDALTNKHGTSAPKDVQDYDGEDANMLIGRLRRAFLRSAEKSRGTSPKQTFELYDAAGRGHVSLRDAKRACALLGCPLSDRAIRVLDEWLRIQHPNVPPSRLSYVALLRSAAPELAREGRTSGSMSAFEVNKALSELRTIVQDASRVRGERIDLKRVCGSLDHRGAGTLTVRQLKEGLARAGIVALPEHIKAIVRKFGLHSATSGSPSRSRRIDYIKLARFASDLESLYAALRPQLRRSAARGVSAWSAFRAVDVNDAGVVSKVDFRRILLAVLGLRLREGELRDLMDEFSSREGAGRVDYERFLRSAAPKGSAGAIGGDLSGLEARVRGKVRTAALRSSGGGGQLRPPLRIFRVQDGRQRHDCQPRLLHR